MKCKILEDRYYPPPPHPQSKFTQDTVWYTDILIMTGHNEACDIKPVITFLFWRRRHWHLTNASNCTFTHTHTHTYTHTHTHEWSGDCSVQTNAFTPRRCTVVTRIPLHPTDTSQINDHLYAYFKPISLHISVITFK